jgi:photosystem II stability/assembly factor-like uncharacterized protein
MGSDLRRRVLSLTATALVATSVLIIGGVNAQAAPAWWSPVALRGIAIARVAASGDSITVRTAAGKELMSTDGGKTFAPSPGAALAPTNTVTVGSQEWAIDPLGHVVHDPDLATGSAAQDDPGTPNLGAGADLIAAPGALPGVVVAVGTDGTVWRRGQDGDWKRALLLLPASLVQGVPKVTSVTAFTTPLSEAIYLGTDGYNVLVSTDGGDDWIRAGPGLPDSVYSLSADSSRHAVYAGTSDGLWVHVLQELPAPPAYQDAALVWRWLGIGAVTLVASALALLGLMRITPRRTTAS